MTTHDNTPIDPGPDGGREVANVHYLPGSRAPITEDVVLDGELVSDEEYRRLTSQRAQAIERYRGYRQDAVTVYRGARAVVTHRATKAAVRHGLAYPVAGAVVVARRWRDAHGLARFERQMRAAETAGDQEALRYWHEAAETAKARRHDRAMDRARIPWLLVKALAGAVFGLCGLLLVLGIILAVDSGRLADVIAPIESVLDAVAFMVWFLTAYGVFLLLTATAGGGFYLWNLGRRHAPEPAWLATPETRSESFAVITEDMITKALAHCKVTALNQALKRGEALEYVVTPRQQGGGTYVQVRLPLGVVASDFLGEKQIELLAGNLGRHKHETYPQRQPEADARVLDLWIADQGTMDRPAPPWPLFTEGEFDVFRDRLPVGITMRGEQVEQGMLARHMLVGASSKQGKTATVRLNALGLALDPTIELRIADLKGDGDWSMFAPRAHTLIEGSAIEQTEATCVMLEDLVEEMQRRYDAKRAQGIRGSITRELSRQPGSGFHPIYGIVDECQVLYAEQHPIGGTKGDARAWRAAKRLHDQARAVNIHLWQATQRPDDRTLPVQVREGAHVRISLYVPNYTTAKMVVADAADMGARPQDLRPGKDAGTIVATGEFDDIPDGMAFLIVKSHYVSTQDAYSVIDRAMDIMRNHGRDPHTASAETEVRDPLADLATVLDGRKLVPQDEVLHLLSALAATYRTWTPADLRAALPDSAQPYKTRNGSMHVSEQRVNDALADRSNTESDNRTPDGR